MRMAPSEFDTLVYKANKFVKIGNIVFENIDTMLYHGVVHNIIFKGKFYQNYIMNTDEMARCVRSGMDSYSDVIQSLSSKYGYPSWNTRMSELNDNGFQSGTAHWEFDKFSIEYEQNQWSRLKNMSFSIESKITYSIPRIETPKAKRQTDSIVDAWERQNREEEIRNQKAIQSL